MPLNGGIIDSLMKGVKKRETCSKFKNTTGVNSDGRSSCGEIQKYFPDTLHYSYVLKGGVLMRSAETGGKLSEKDDTGLFSENEKKERALPLFSDRSCLHENCEKSCTLPELPVDVDSGIDRSLCPRRVHISPRKPQDQSNGMGFLSSLEVFPKEKLLRKAILEQSVSSSCLTEVSLCSTISYQDGLPSLRDEMCSSNVCKNEDNLSLTSHEDLPYGKRKRECTDVESNKTKRKTLPSCLEKLYSEGRNVSSRLTIEIKSDNSVLEQKGTATQQRELFSARNQDMQFIPFSSTLDQCSMHSHVTTASSGTAFVSEEKLNYIDTDENDSWDSYSSVKWENESKSAAEICDLESDDENETPLPVEQIFSSSLKPPLDTPDKSSLPTSSQQSTPVFKTLFPVLKHNTYSNDLERMVKEKKELESLDELEKKLQDGIKKRSSGLCLTEEAEQSTEDDESIAEEHREFVRRFSIVVDVIPDSHPAEEIFHPEDFGKLLSPEILDLKNYCISTQNPLEKLIASGDANLIKEVVKEEWDRFSKISDLNIKFESLKFVFKKRQMY
ncbi:uncharacterized protein LOC122788732 [Protopterus annectens]|uniref:uncharacterized protein LOC122788732 n=1 Tax=Protopterus annectens TaxID=7888 RepID=UPI001CF99DF2|nr:uncharacterized protein LOC122788732 [Protopterus annectens]